MEASIRRLKLIHLVVAYDGTTFASGRDGRGRIHNYLISCFGDIKRQVNSHFEVADRDESCWIKHILENTDVPVYRIPRIDFS